MSALNKTTIENYIKIIDDNSTNLGLLRSAYGTNIQNIETDLNAISFDYWDDDIASALSGYKNFIKNDALAKLKNSLSNEGTFNQLELLLNDLKSKCQTCLDLMNGVGDLYMGVQLSSTGDSFVFQEGSFISSTDYASTHYVGTEDDCATLNTELVNQFAAITDTLTKLQNLKFDDVIDYELAATSTFELPDTPHFEFVPITEDPTQEERVIVPITINQGDKVMVYKPPSVEGEEGENIPMYYLGTDNKGRSYFSESMEESALVYRAILPNGVSTAQTYLNDTEYLGDPLLGSGFASARIGFVLLGGNTGDMTVGNILSYPNGAYTGDANFNTSLVYDDSSQAPEVVELGEGTYDPSNAYHMVYIEPDNCVSLQAIYDEAYDLSSHPTIVLQPGEKITTKYGGILGIDFTKEKHTIGSDDVATYLVWDDARGRYYVIGEDGGYYTSARYGDYGRGYRYVSIESLMAGDTQVTIK